MRQIGAEGSHVKAGTSSRGTSWAAILVAIAAMAMLAAPSAARAASPDNGTVAANAQGQGNTITWSGSVHTGSETGGQDEGAGCFDADGKPADTTTTGCDIFTLTVNVPPDFYQHFIGGPPPPGSRLRGALPGPHHYNYKTKPHRRGHPS